MEVFVVTYVGLSDTEYDANGYSNVFVCATLEEAKKKLASWREAEIGCLVDEERDYEILEDEDDYCRISWCAHGNQVILEIHPVTFDGKELDELKK